MESAGHESACRSGANGLTSAAMPKPRGRFAEGITIRSTFALAVVTALVSCITVDQSH